MVPMVGKSGEEAAAVLPFCREGVSALGGRLLEGGEETVHLLEKQAWLGPLVHPWLCTAQKWSWNARVHTYSGW